MARASLFAVPDPPDEGAHQHGTDATRHASPVNSPDAPPPDPSNASQDAVSLLSRIARGSDEAFAMFYRRFSARVYGLARRVVRDSAQAEEVAQEVFLDIWRRASHFEPTKGSVASWVLTLTHSRAVERIRSAQAATDRELRTAAASAEREVDTVSEAVQHRAERRAVQSCLETLTDLQHQSIILAYYGGYSYPQVADLLHIPLPTIKTRMRDGLIRLRDCLRATL